MIQVRKTNKMTRMIIASATLRFEPRLFNVPGACDQNRDEDDVVDPQDNFRAL